MNIDRLVAMANDIGTFFAAESPPERAAEDVAQHLRRFWEPRIAGRSSRTCVSTAVRGSSRRRAARSGARRGRFVRRMRRGPLPWFAGAISVRIHQSFKRND